MSDSRPVRDTQDYLYEHIPLSKALGVEVVRADPGGVVLHAPLEPNLNHRSTGFGGSVSALSILAGWTLLHVSVADRVPGVTIVIKRSEVDFIQPVTGDLEVVCLPASSREWDRLSEAMSRKGRGRVRLGVRVASIGGLCALFRGQYVLWGPAHGSD